MTIAALRSYRLLAALLCWLSTQGPALSAEPLARAALQSQGTLYVGQQILVDVDVLVPNYFLQPPQFPAIDIPGAIVTLDDGRALNLNETIDGAPYSGIRRSYILVPQAAGDFTLPPAPITFGYAAVPPQATRGEVTLPPLRFTVRSAPDTAGDSPGVVAAKVSVSQELDQDPAALKAGDTLVRTVTVRAEGLRAMMIPEPDFTAPQGVRLYRQDPSLSEETDRNGQSVAGLRKDVASYLFQDPGDYVLPAVTLNWFDPASATTQSATAAAVSVTVAAVAARSPALAPPAPEPQRQAFDWLHVAVIGGSVILIAAALWAAANGLSRLEAWWQERRSKERQSEPAFFRQVEQACKTGSDDAIARALDAWSRKAGAMPLEFWLGRFADAETKQVYQAWQRTRYASQEASSQPIGAGLLLPGLKKARKAWLTQGAEAPGRKPALLPLNPTMP